MAGGKLSRLTPGASGRFGTPSLRSQAGDSPGSRRELRSLPRSTRNLCIKTSLLVTALLSLPDLPLAAAAPRRPGVFARDAPGGVSGLWIGATVADGGAPHSGCDSMLASAIRGLTLRADFDSFFAGLNVRPYGPRHEKALDGMAAELDGKFKGVRRNPIPPNSCYSTPRTNHLDLMSLC